MNEPSMPPKRGPSSARHSDLVVKYMKNGPDSFSPEEAVRFILGFICPQKDAASLTKTLFKHFGTASRILNAAQDELLSVKGMSKDAALILCSLKKVCPERFGDQKSHADINCRIAACKMCSAALNSLSRECLMEIGFSGMQKIILKKTLSEGTLCETGADPEIIVGEAFKAGCRAVVLAHIHPYGSCLPSPGDIKITRITDAELGKFGIYLIDHIIVSPEGSRGFYRKIE